MKCWICNSVEIQDIIIDIKDNKIRHCHECESAIQENLAMISHEKKPKDKVEDITGELPLLDEDFDLEKFIEGRDDLNIEMEDNYIE